MTESEILQMPTFNSEDFITWRSFVGQPEKGWMDAQHEENEANWASLMNQHVEPDEVDDTAIFETFLIR